MEPTGIKHWSQGSTPGDMNDFDVRVVFTWPTGQSTDDMVCSFGFCIVRMLGRPVLTCWQYSNVVRRTMQNAAAAASLKRKKVNLETGEKQSCVLEFDGTNTEMF